MAGTYDWSIAQRLRDADIPFDALIFGAILKADNKNMENLLIGFPELVAEANQHYKGTYGDDIPEVEKLARQFKEE